MGLSIEEKEKRAKGIEEKRTKKWNDEHKLIDGMDHKLCSKCKIYHPATTEYFYKNKSNKVDGLNPYCIKCDILKSVVWRTENPEKFKKNEKKRSATEKRRLKVKKNCETYRDNGGRRKWELKNKSKINGYQKERFSNKKHEISSNEWRYCKNYFNNECAYCGLHIENHFRMYAKKLQKIDLHKDHADHNGSNRIDNCIPSCLNCNSSKHDSEMVEWYESSSHYNGDRLSKMIKWLSVDYQHIK